MRVNGIDTLRTAIRETHGCQAELVDSVYVREISPTGRLWEGHVGIFATDHSDAARCYAWTLDEGVDEPLEVVTMLGRAPIISARLAVRASLRLDPT